MSFRVQIFHAEPGPFLNTNHELDDLEEMRKLVDSGIFDRFRCRVVDETGAEIPLDRGPGENQDVLTIDDIARALKVPVLRGFGDGPLPAWAGPDDRPV